MTDRCQDKPSAPKRDLDSRVFTATKIVLELRKELLMEEQRLTRLIDVADDDKRRFSAVLRDVREHLSSLSDAVNGTLEQSHEQ